MFYRSLTSIAIIRIVIEEFVEGIIWEIIVLFIICKKFIPHLPDVLVIPIDSETFLSFNYLRCLNIKIDLNLLIRVLNLSWLQSTFHFQWIHLIIFPLCLSYFGILIIVSLILLELRPNKISTSLLYDCLKLWRMIHSSIRGTLKRIFYFCFSHGSIVIVWWPMFKRVVEDIIW